MQSPSENERSIHARGDHYSQGTPGEDRLVNGRLMSRCPRCGVFVQDDYLVCPYCALSLKKECFKCKHQIPLNWNACSYCGHIIVNILPSDKERLTFELPEQKFDTKPVAVTVKGKVILRGRCPQCSRLIMDDARFCDCCGWKVEDHDLKPISLQ
jgi:RNA polymerase subunit RPABC4/transcription elongation factor Spt4